MDLTLDYHAHILPGCDHGSDSVQTSLRQLSMARAAGIGTVCATPHFYPHREDIETFLSRRESAYVALSEHLTEGSPAVRLGAEVLICDGMDSLENLDSLCLQGSRELLLEMPFYTWPKAVWDTLYRLHEREDIQLVMAHADRYPAEDIECLIAEGIALQLNAVCLTKPLHRKRYLQWIRHGYVRYLGSDIHMLGDHYKDFEKCRKLLNKYL